MKQNVKSHVPHVIYKPKPKYVDTGKIRLVCKIYPPDFHQNAKVAAVAAECAIA